MVRTARKGWAGACMAALLAAAMTIPAQVAPAQATNLLLENFWLPNDSYSGDVPACTEPLALGTISMRFAETERMYWHNDLNIAGYANVKEIAFRPWGESFVPRRYCSATVTTTDAKRHTLYYSIAEDGGMSMVGWGVQWCIPAFDREFAYAPNCKMARP